jgi:hypothetical protein
MSWQYIQSFWNYYGMDERQRYGPSERLIFSAFTWEHTDSHNRGNTGFVERTRNVMTHVSHFNEDLQCLQAKWDLLFWETVKGGDCIYF